MQEITAAQWQQAVGHVAWQATCWPVPESSTGVQPDPAWTAALARLAARHGYRAGWGTPNPGADATTAGWPHLTITVQRSTRPAYDFAVLAHELAHVLGGHVPSTQAELRARMPEYMAYGDPGEDPVKEVSADLAAGALCLALGLGSGAVPQYVAARYHGQMPPAHVRAQAARFASQMYSAIRGATREQVAA